MSSSRRCTDVVFASAVVASCLKARAQTKRKWRLGQSEHDRSTRQTQRGAVPVADERRMDKQTSQVQPTAASAIGPI